MLQADAKHINLTAGRNGQLLVMWWIPQIPMKPFTVLIDSFEVAKALLESLAKYDLFCLENNIKPDYSNTGGVMVFEDGEWTDWYCDETGDTIDDLSMEQCRTLDEKRYVAVKVPVAKT